MLEEIILAKFLNWNSRIHPVGQVKTAEPWVAAWQTSMSSTPNWTMYCNSWNRCSLNWPEGGWQFHSSELLVSIPSSITSDRATGKKKKKFAPQLYLFGSKYVGNVVLHRAVSVGRHDSWPAPEERTVNEWSNVQTNSWMQRQRAHKQINKQIGAVRKTGGDMSKWMMYWIIHSEGCRLCVSPGSTVTFSQFP